MRSYHTTQKTTLSSEQSQLQLTSRRNVCRCAQQVTWTRSIAVPSCRHWRMLIGLLTARVSVYDMGQRCVRDASLHWTSCTHTHRPCLARSRTFSGPRRAADRECCWCCHCREIARFAVN